MNELNLKKLSEGLVVDNYPAMCNLLDEKVKGGKSKKLQLERWKKYFDWEMDGHKFIITKIRELPLPKKIYGNDLYARDILSVVFGLLANKKDTKNYYTIKELLYFCGFVNENYKDKKDTLSVFAEENGCSYQQAQYLYNKLYQHINSYSKRALERCLKRLQKRGIIKFEIAYFIKYLNNKNGKFTTVEEEKTYKKIYDSVKKRLDITYVGLYNESTLYKEVNKELNKINIEFCYKVYIIDWSGNSNTDYIEIGDVVNARQNINDRIIKKMFDYVDTDIKKKIKKQLLSDGLDEEYADIIESLSAYDEMKKKLQREIELKKALVDFYIAI